MPYFVIITPGAFMSTRRSPLLGQDPLRKPGPAPDQVRGRLLRNHAPSDPSAPGFQGLPPPACLIASHTLAGVAGMSISATPSGRSASSRALITVGGAPIVPDSPMPLTPSGLVRHGTSSSVVPMSG